MTSGPSSARGATADPVDVGLPGFTPDVQRQARLVQHRADDEDRGAGFLALRIEAGR